MVVEPALCKLIKDGLRSELNWSNPVGLHTSARVTYAEYLRSDTVYESEHPRRGVFCSCRINVRLVLILTRTNTRGHIDGCRDVTLPGGPSGLEESVQIYSVLVLL